MTGKGVRLKQCSKCNQSKPTTEFHKSIRSPSGLNPQCKTCVNKKLADWKKANPERTREIEKTYRERNRQKVKQSSLNWYHSNRKTQNQKSREYARRNKEAQAIRGALWKKNNPEKVRESTNRRRIRKQLNGEYFISDKEIKRLYAAPCVYCGSLQRITVDHVIPISRGGVHSIGNLVSACLSCNSSKRDKTIMEWKKLDT